MPAENSDVELRGMCPREVIDVLDAVSSHRRASRMELVNTILREWADDKKREMEALRRVVGAGPGGAR